MSLPGLAKLAKVNLKASVPKDEMPLGNSLVVFLIIDSACSWIDQRPGWTKNEQIKRQCP